VWGAFVSYLRVAACEVSSDTINAGHNAMTALHRAFGPLLESSWELL